MLENTITTRIYIYIYIYFFFLKTLQQGYFITPIFFYFYLKYRDINNVGRSSPLGMATGRVRAGFFHTRTRPAGQDPWPGPAPFRVSGFFPGPRPAPAGPHGPRGPRLEIGPNSWPNQKKKKKKSRFFFPTFKPNFFFFSIQACVFQIKKLSPNLFLPTFKPTYLNSSLDNVAQMPNHRLLIINQ